MINIVKGTSTGGKLLGRVAQAVVPWTSERGDAAAQAILYCSKLPTTGTNASTGILLASLAYITDCATRMARSDLFVGNSEADTDCTTAGNGDGVVSQNDISQDPLGNVNATFHGMCHNDVLQCTTDVTSLSSANIATAGLSDISSNVSSIPADIVSGVVSTVRQGLRATLDQ